MMYGEDNAFAKTLLNLVLTNLYVMDETRLINGSVFHVLNFVTIELMRYGYRLSMSGEMKDMMGLMNTDSDKWMKSDSRELICIDTDLELLEDVNEVRVQLIMRSINRIAEFKDVYELISNLDMEEVLVDEEIVDESYGIFNTYSIDMEDDGSYDQVADNLDMFYCSICMIVMYLITQLELGKLEVYDETQDFNYKYYCVEGFELEPEKPISRMLVDLLAGLNQDANDLANLDITPPKV